MPAVNAKALIRKTRDGERLTAEEIDFLVRGATTGQVPSYQLTAWMMAVYLRGLSVEETVHLTRSMLDSGERIAFSGLSYPPADKHSTGGVGDKLSFLVAPLVAAAGVPVPMISGRSLGHTGGTLDKLESIAGFRTRLEPGEMVRQVESIGLCIAGQTEHLSPADRVLYSLRDAASIVESIPLITASILCKKAAAGVKALVLDVKCGDGAFMADPAQARNLARSLVDTAGLLGMKARAHLTSMERVLGRTAGNALEIAEAVRFLRGERPAADLLELTLALGGSMLEMAGQAASRAEAEATLRRLWRSGAGWERFLRMVEAQGGQAEVLEDVSRLPSSDRVIDLEVPESGWFAGVRARPAGEWITEAGGGRLRTGDRIDHRIGLEILPELGQRVERGQTVLRLHLGDQPAPPSLRERARGWILLRAEKPQADPREWSGLPLLGDVIDPGSAAQRSPGSGASS